MSQNFPYVSNETQYEGSSSAPPAASEKQRLWSS